MAGELPDPIWLRNIPVKLIKAKAEASGISWTLLAAVVQQESGGREFAQRYEPSWHYFADPAHYAKKLGITHATEQHAQSFSYGLMQIMGSVAREEGFTGYLGQLFDPEINLGVGSRKLRKLIQRYKTLEDAIASYNAGSPRKEEGRYVNQSYVNSVIAYMHELEGIG